MKRKWLVAAAVVALGFAALGFYSVRLLLAESLYTTRGSYAYWLAVSPIIRNVPEVGAVSEAQFYTSAGDGPKQPENTVSYTSQAPPDQIRSQISTYLTGKGYQRRTGTAEEFAKGYSIVTITIKPEQNGGKQRVTVTEVF